jgi:exopolyphosphatase / guanosine-5'-triphosphate,3'-diphosphate pyrophosphatase
MKRMGIVDLGSNSSRLVIYEIKGNGSYRPIYRVKKNIQLARCIQEDGTLSEEGKEKAALSLRAFQNIGRLYKVNEWTAVATAALRQATNGQEVLAYLEQETNLSIRLLTGDEEAYFGYLGVINTLDLKNAVLVDIGGASTEIMHVENRQLLHAVSLPYGALTLARKFEALPSLQQTLAIFDFFQTQLSSLPWLAPLSGYPLIGIGGTMRAVGKISLRMQGSVLNRIHGYEVKAPVVMQIFDSIKMASIEQRKKLGDLSESRADVIHAGVAAVWALAHQLDSPYLGISGSGLREGLFFEKYLENSASLLLPSVKEHSLRNMMELYDVNVDVAIRTARCAERLFDGLAKFVPLPPEHRDLLYGAALLYLTGLYINVEKYVKHTDYLLRSSHLYGYTEDEMEDLGLVVIGKGSKTFKQLNLIVQMAKYLVHEIDVDVEEIEVTVNKREVLVSTYGEVIQMPRVDLEALNNGFEKHFQLRLSQDKVKR